MCGVPSGVTAVCQAGVRRTQPPGNSTVPPMFGSATFSTPVAADLVRQLDDRDHLCAGALGDVHGVAEVVGVAVGQQDVGRLELRRPRPRPSGCRSGRGRRAGGCRRRSARSRTGRESGSSSGLLWSGLGIVQSTRASSQPTATPTSMPMRVSSASRVRTGRLVPERPCAPALVGLAEPAAGVQRLVQDPLQLRRGARHARLRLPEALGIAQRLDRRVELLVGEGRSAISGARTAAAPGPAARPPRRPRSRPRSSPR